MGPTITQVISHQGQLYGLDSYGQLYIFRQRSPYTGEWKLVQAEITREDDPDPRTSRGKFEL